MNYQRLFLFMGLILSLFTALWGRIFYFQVIRGEEISLAATVMRSQRIELREQQRGDILDRNRQPLTNTNTSTALFLSPDLVKRDIEARQKEAPGLTETEYYKQLAASMAAVATGLSGENVKAIVQAALPQSHFVMIKQGLEQAEIQHLTEAALPGLVLAPFNERYGHEGFCAHVLGYTDRSQEGAGKSGIEKSYDYVLRGAVGAPQMVSVVDARGRAIPGLTGKLQASGEERGAVVLTIDRRIQEVAEKAMDYRAERGAAVVIDTHSKEILAMVSRPAFDPYSVDEAIVFDGRSPLTNRALSSYYPGSLFKVLLTAAALEEGLVDFDDQYNCSGQYVFNDQVAISCLKKEGHGLLRFEEAFARSCNPSFIEVGLRLGRTRLLYYVDKVHFIDETLLGYESIAPGSYVKIDGGAAAMGNASLGQQGVMVTPLQIASLLATVADDGVWAAPSLVKYTLDQDGHRTPVPGGERIQVISPSTAAQLRLLMEQVVENGTGRAAAIPETRVAGKTATSQTGQMTSEDEEALNTWFAGYLPADKPRWAIVVMVEEGSSGAKNCAPIFRDISQGILQYY
ncbi:MAG: penicillin-binding protein 2 [Syntrophomonadaceae bacterium]|nr:penicillin-binding protein 2 [Syntrophomonadaceae bacterium]